MREILTLDLLVTLPEFSPGGGRFRRRHRRRFRRRCCCRHIRRRHQCRCHNRRHFQLSCTQSRNRVASRQNSAGIDFNSTTTQEKETNKI